MPRAKRGFKGTRRRNRLLSMSKGFFGRRKNIIRLARETVLRAGAYAYRDRRVKRREFRSLWIQRINAAARELGLTYSVLMNLLSKANIQIDRRVLAHMAYSDPAAFKAVVESVRKVA